MELLYGSVAPDAAATEPRAAASWFGMPATSMVAPPTSSTVPAATQGRFDGAGDAECCSQTLPQSLTLCRPLMPSVDCLAHDGPRQCNDSCDDDRRNGQLPNWMRIWCCADDAATPQHRTQYQPQAVILRNAILDATMANDELSGFQRNKQSYHGKTLYEAFLEPAIPLHVPAPGELSEEREREYTEVELEGEAICYRGQWLGRLKHGEGLLTMPDGRSFEGQFQHDLAHGHGTLILASGAKLEGNWDKGKAEGFGHYDYRGNTYEGQWTRDEKNGRGTESWPDGSCYVGEFLGNLRHGTGVYRTPAGAVYEGQFRDDRMDGRGRYTFADGHTYQGEWRHGHQDGKGVIEWQNGFKYEGSFSNDRKSGEGVATWPNGRMYRGQWRDGQQHGIGISADPDGFEEERLWDNGKLMPVGTGAISKKSSGNR